MEDPPTIADLNLTIAELVRMHTAIAETLDPTVANQNDFRMAAFGAMLEVGEAFQHLPWRPWRTADRRPPTAEELEAAIPELADALGALLRCVANLGIDPDRFERACALHIATKFQRIRNGVDG